MTVFFADENKLLSKFEGQWGRKKWPWLQLHPQTMVYPNEGHSSMGRDECPYLNRVYHV